MECRISRSEERSTWALENLLWDDYYYTAKGRREKEGMGLSSARPAVNLIRLGSVLDSSCGNDGQRTLIWTSGSPWTIASLLGKRLAKKWCFIILRLDALSVRALITIRPQPNAALIEIFRVFPERRKLIWIPAGRSTEMNPRSSLIWYSNTKITSRGLVPFFGRQSYRHRGKPSRQMTGKMHDRRPRPPFWDLMWHIKYK